MPIIKGVAIVTNNKGALGNPISKVRTSCPTP
jgi:hypothetical protein